MSVSDFNPRESLFALHDHLSRRGFLRRSASAAGIALFCDRFGEKLFAQASTSSTNPLTVLSAMGNVIIPVDSDPGWASWDPGISQYTWNSFIPQVLLGGNPQLFAGISLVVQFFNDLPPTVAYNGNPFLSMNLAAQTQYYGDVLEGGLQNYGTQDVMFLAVFVALFACKAVFYSNYPNHLAVQGQEFQSPLPATKIPTAWTQIGYKGPVSQAEEAMLRAKYANVPMIPGLDPNNKFI